MCNEHPIIVLVYHPSIEKITKELSYIFILDKHIRGLCVYIDIDVTNLFTMKPTKLLLKMCITKHWNDVTDAYDRDVKIEARFVFFINMIGLSAKTSYFQKRRKYKLVDGNKLCLQQLMPILRKFSHIINMIGQYAIYLLNDV